MNLAHFLKMLRSRAPLALTILLVTVGTALLVSLLLPRTYEASAQVLIDIKTNRLGGEVDPFTLDKYLATQVDVVQSDRVAQRVKEITRLPGELNEILKKLTVKAGRESSVLTITFRASDPQTAADVANAFAQAYIDTVLELRVNPARQYSGFFDQQVKDRGYKLVPAAFTVNFPIGLYSKKVKSLDELKEGAKFGVPNDPTNGGRVLLVLQDKGLIKLRPEAGLKATPLDVTSNPKKLRFVELDAAQLARSLDDLDAAAINTNYALSAGLQPGKDSIAQESAKSPYVNIIAVREQDKDKPWVATLVKAYHSDAVRQFVKTEFKGAVLPSW